MTVIQTKTSYIIPSLHIRTTKSLSGSGGIRTHASEETGALNQRLRPLGHATIWVRVIINLYSVVAELFFDML